MNTHLLDGWMNNRFLFSLSIEYHEEPREVFKQISANISVHMPNSLNYIVLEQALFCDPSNVHNSIIINVPAGRNN